MELISKRVLFIDGRNKASGDFNNPVFNLNSQDGFFNVDSNQKILICPLSFQILNDFYNINDTNNQLVFTINTKSNPSANPISGFVWDVDNGYYDVYNLAEYLQLVLKAQFDSEFGSQGGGSYVFTVNIDYSNDISGYTFTITATNNFFTTYDLTLSFETITTGIGTLICNNPINNFLGFQVTQTATVDADNEIISSYPINFLYKSTIFLRTNICGENKEFNNTSLITSNLFMDIANDVPKLSMIKFLNNNKLYQTECRSNISQIEFRLTDEDENLIEFKSDMKISIEFEKYEHKKNDSLSILKDIKNINEASLMIKSLQMSIENIEKKTYEFSNEEIETMEDNYNKMDDAMQFNIDL